MTYWLIPIQEDMWDVIKDEGVYGYKSKLDQYIQKGDFLIIYVSKYYAKVYGGKVVGIVRVVSDWYFDETPIFPEEKVRNKGIYPYRVKVQTIVSGVCDFKSILDKINFIEDKAQLAKYLRNAPANLKRPIPEEDAKIIQQCLEIG
ncbi:EVE domain-containing protein [Acidianus sulfidivorans JP7]|uniref:EVE domain-containing protein n=1 Tax=Acidianus sulfidivorans JP7 TaxID=619593 RepID=A0A2U9IM43_9CREN|nr:EVE domain-containing protein [Acidianus sulfidivorans]AWR96984.1 EVE domain-containing protein [Acidianus sulfidivorans JP7]